MATVSGRRSGIAGWWVLGLAAAALLVAAIALHEQDSSLHHTSVAGPVADLPNMDMVGARPTRGEVRRAFADHGLGLYSADADILKPRFASVRTHLVGMWQVPGPSGLLIAVFDRNVSALAGRVARLPAGYDQNAASGRVYLEVRSAGLGPINRRLGAALAELHRISTPA